MVEGVSVGRGISVGMGVGVEENPSRALQELSRAVVVSTQMDSQVRILKCFDIFFLQNDKNGLLPSYENSLLKVELDKNNKVNLLLIHIKSASIKWGLLIFR
jgi:hypothetical protein